MELSSSQKEIVCHQFDNFCKRLLKNEVRDYFREVNRRQKQEVLFSEMSAKEINELWAVDKYSTDIYKFIACGFEIEIENDLLAESLLKLPVKSREIILLAYFEGMTDAEIATALNMARRTVHHRRTSSLIKLNKYMGGKTDEEE